MRLLISAVVRSACLFLMVVAGSKFAQAVPVTSGLVLHFDAQDTASILNPGATPAANGQFVETWVGQVGGINANPFNDSFRPVFNATGAPFDRPSIDFDLTDNLETDTATQARTVILFHRWDVGGNPTEYLFDFRTGVSGSAYVFHQTTTATGGNWTSFYVNGSTTPGVAATDLRTEEWQMTTFYGSGTGTDLMRMMSRYTTANPGLGAFGEVMVYDRLISQAERLDIFSYVNDRWLTAPPVPVPEPATFLLCAFSLFGLKLGRKSRRS